MLNDLDLQQRVDTICESGTREDLVDLVRNLVGLLLEERGDRRVLAEMGIWESR